MLTTLARSRVQQSYINAIFGTGIGWGIWIGMGITLGPSNQVTAEDIRHVLAFVDAEVDIAQDFRAVGTVTVSFGHAF